MVAVFAACDFSNADLTGRACPCLSGSFYCEPSTSRCEPTVLGEAFSMHLSSGSAQVAVGKTSTVHVVVERRAFEGSILVGALDLPPSVRATPASLLGGPSEVDLAISAGA